MCQPGRISACQVAIALAFVTLLGGVAHAFTIASESFPYVAGSILDGQGSGFGWDTGAFVLRRRTEASV